VALGRGERGEPHAHGGLGCFNLTLKGHGECVRFVKGFGVPLLVLGGGGYTIRNVARCWAYETSVVLDTPLGEDIPYNDYYEYYAPDFKLHLTPSMAMENLNEREELERTTQEVLENLSALKGAPSLTLQDVPPDWATRDAGAAADAADPDQRQMVDEKTGAEKAEHPAEFEPKEGAMDTTD